MSLSTAEERDVERQGPKGLIRTRSNAKMPKTVWRNTRAPWSGESSLRVGFSQIFTISRLFRDFLLFILRDH